MEYRELFILEPGRAQELPEATASGDSCSGESCAIKLLLVSDWPAWLAQQSAFRQQQVVSIGFQAKSGQFMLFLDEAGRRQLVVLVLDSCEQFLEVGGLAAKLPPGCYYLLEEAWTAPQLTHFALAWGLGGYRFEKYLSSATQAYPRLILPHKLDLARWQALLASSFQVWDLINESSEQLYPQSLAEVARRLAAEFAAEIRIVEGAQLAHDFPAVAMVGRGSVRPPCLIDLTWHAPRDSRLKLTLVGKGVCFDAGGLDLKSSRGMLQMKKDMAGAAYVLGIARLIMQLALPLQLRVIIPAVENLPSGSAMKVRDIIRMRSGHTVEIGDTDAEGRLILADALSLAIEDQPDLIVDLATLTGAAEVALGTDMAALFSNHDGLAQQLMEHMGRAQEPVWRLPLYQPYLSFIRTAAADLPADALADLNNTAIAAKGSGGAITAALFLQQFVGERPWMHLDFCGGSHRTKPGASKGNETLCLRGMLTFLEELVEAK